MKPVSKKSSAFLVCALAGCLSLGSLVAHLGYTIALLRVHAEVLREARQGNSGGIGTEGRPDRSLVEFNRSIFPKFYILGGTLFILSLPLLTFGILIAPPSSTSDERHRKLARWKIVFAVGSILLVGGALVEVIAHFSNPGLTLSDAASWEKFLRRQTLVILSELTYRAGYNVIVTAAFIFLLRGAPEKRQVAQELGPGA